MIDRDRLLADLKRLRADIEDDLQARCREHPGLEAHLRGVHREAVAQERTAESYDSWRDEHLTQVAVAWILGCVFVRFLEDNALVDPPRLSGPGGRRQRALDEHTLYFRAHPEESDRDYLHHVFRAVAALPGADRIFDEAHNPIWSLEQPGEEFRAPSGDAAGRLLGLWQRIDPDSGALAHDFTDPAWDTRFLGDLYQDLSESARKRYALLQTPEFVEEFILDRTLDPAVEEFGFREVRLIDPACGSGHFLLGAFRRIDAPVGPARAGHERSRPGEPRARTGGRCRPESIRRRDRALPPVDRRPPGVWRAPPRRRAGLGLHVAAGDSLLHGPRPGLASARQEYLDPDHDPLTHVYRTEDAEALRTILGRRYHVVVGNPPYITPKDKAINHGYRRRFGSCHRKYSLAVPFTERFFDLARAPAPREVEPAGFIGMITANSFMKREFGKKLIEEFVPRWDLTHVVDTSGAYVPGHGTPTVILFGRQRPPLARTVRAVMGIRGEPTIPDDAAKGRVWSAIVKQIDHPGLPGKFVDASDTPREHFETHPWSIGGGGASARLKTLLEGTSQEVLSGRVESIGFASFKGTDDAFVNHARTWIRSGVSNSITKTLVLGEALRDWCLQSDASALVPYDDHFKPLPLDARSHWARHLWTFRTTIGAVVSFGSKTRAECSDLWWTWYRLVPEKYRTSLSIAFAFVATHNHFVLDRGGSVFNRTAPLIKLPAATSEDEHLGLLGLLNSSTACFWMKQLFYNRGGGGIGGGLATEEWEQFYEFDSTKLQNLPLINDPPLQIARMLDALATEWTRSLPTALVECGAPSAGSLLTARTRTRQIREQMIAAQEELDWRCYGLYKVTDDDLCTPRNDVPPVRLGERAFEIVLARRIAAGRVETKWFERHGSTPITEIPAHWPAAYRTLVQRRIETIEKNANVALIEQPEYKRRWNDQPWEAQQERALRGWLLDRLEAPALWPETRLTTTAALADQMRDDAGFLQVAALYAGRPDFDVARLVARLVEEESVPLLPVLRYKPSGLRKRDAWERTWALQRMEGRHRRAGRPARDQPRAADAGSRGGPQGGPGRDRPRPTALRVGRLPEGRVVAPAGQARRAQAPLRQPAGLRARRRPVAGRRLGGLERAGAEPGRRRILQPDARAGGLDGGAASAPARGPAGAAAVGAAVPQHARPRVRRRDGRLLRGVHRRRGASALADPRRPPRLDTARASGPPQGVGMTPTAPVRPRLPPRHNRDRSRAAAAQALSRASVKSIVDSVAPESRPATRSTSRASAPSRLRPAVRRGPSRDAPHMRPDAAAPRRLRPGPQPPSRTLWCPA